jgi:acetoacetyl-CoA synthetase
MTPLWQPDAARISGTRLTKFIDFVAARTGRRHNDLLALHQFSVTDTIAFWEALWEFAGVIGDRGARTAIDLDRMPGARFFPDARLNFAENVLRRTDETPAIIAASEDGAERTISYRALREDVLRVAAALRAEGVEAGDRVCGLVSNVPETIVAALGAASIGAVWSSASPDFGVQGVLDRFGQITPTVFIAVESYQYAGKTHDCTSKISAIAEAIPSVRRVVVVPSAAKPAGTVADAVSWSDWIGAQEAATARFERLPFDHPLYILYSSGTTGVPKCIIHGAGGTLVQHLKEHQLHCDIRPNDRVFYYTTCGWMMWNWLVTVLASEATIVLYDGAALHPTADRLFALADRVGLTLFGTSAKFIDAVAKSGITPRASHPMTSLRTMTSTGSPLAPESFDFVYRAIAPDVHLASISGGTDIVSCFVGGNPNGPVWRGEIQAPGLAMDVDVFDPNGRPIQGTAGELVCKSPFPSMPVGFWDDPKGEKYHAAYFERFPGVWCHGDWISTTDHGGYIIFGRSDATLNPGGVRIGTAEIYRQVEQLDDVVECLAVGQRWQGDERIVLFVRLAPGVTLDEALRERIARKIRANTSPRHVPARIIEVSDIPRTKSGKIVELAVRSVIHGQEVKNRESLANPEALELFRDLPDLRT